LTDCAPPPNGSPKRRRPATVSSRLATPLAKNTAWWKPNSKPRRASFRRRVPRRGRLESELGIGAPRKGRLPRSIQGRSSANRITKRHEEVASREVDVVNLERRVRRARARTRRGVARPRTDRRRRPCTGAGTAGGRMPRDRKTA
jgi:hypothetical protein